MSKLWPLAQRKARSSRASGAAQTGQISMGGTGGWLAGKRGRHDAADRGVAHDALTLVAGDAPGQQQMLQVGERLGEGEATVLVRGEPAAEERLGHRHRVQAVGMAGE